MKEVDILARQLGYKIVGRLSEEYGFSRSDAEVLLGLNKIEVSLIESKVRNKVTVVLPFCGSIKDRCCNGIRLNHGLYTQCSNDISDESGKYPVCSTCSKQVEKNSNGEPTYGYVQSRLEKGENYKDPKGKSAVNYGNIMEKLKITREEATTAAEELGWTIPESQFEVKRATRGRPKKDASAVDTSSEFSEEEEQDKKPRGRPKKDKKVISSNTGDNIIKDLVKKANCEAIAEAKAEAKAEESDNVEEEEEEDEEEGVQAQPIKMIKNGYIVLDVEVEGESPAGTDYLINPKDNTLYDPKTFDDMGTWNPTTKRIDQSESETE
jgi:hypothetical protein